MIFVIILFFLQINISSAESLNDKLLTGEDGEISLSMLTATDIDINAINDDGFTPLTLASRFCLPKTAELLLNAGADINKVDKYGVPPIYHSLVENCAILTKILIDLGANVRWVDKENGNNLLHYATVWGADIEVVNLIEAGVDINGLNGLGESPLRELLNWEGVDPTFKEQRANLLRKYGAKDVYLRLQNSPPISAPATKRSKNDDLDESERKKNRTKDHSLE